MLRLFARHKYKIGVFLLLLMASVIDVALVVTRVLYTDTRRHVSLIWNLFLAWIPFLLAYIAYVFSWRRWMVYLIVPAFLFCGCSSSRTLRISSPISRTWLTVLLKWRSGTM